MSVLTILNLVLAAINLAFAIEGFNRHGYRNYSPWISLAVAMFCLVTAMLPDANLTAE